MTRGMKGCYVYCVDKELARYLKKRVHQSDEIVYDDNEIKNNLSKVADVENNNEYKYDK